MLIKQTRVGSRVYRWSIMATTAEWRGALSFSPQLRYFPASSFASQCGTRSRVGVESLTELHVEHCIIYAQRGARAPTVKETKAGWKTTAIPESDRFAKRVTCLQTFREFPLDSRPSTRWNVRPILRYRLILYRTGRCKSGIIERYPRC